MILTLLMQEAHFGNHCSRQKSTQFTLKMHLDSWESDHIVDTFNCLHFICYVFVFCFCFILFVVVFTFLREKKWHGFSTLLPSQCFKQETHWKIVSLVIGWIIILEQLKLGASLPKMHHKATSPLPHDSLWWVICRMDKSKVAAVCHSLLLL